ncbi:LamG domain-containing protein [Streptomyces sp. B6B3]|uniref:LamG domain-containing protein n=1 Tax=Streptomyces sp. B6B3 TaxID=3153570 RepID=UPI00325FD6B4
MRAAVVGGLGWALTVGLLGVAEPAVARNAAPAREASQTAEADAGTDDEPGAASEEAALEEAQRTGEPVEVLSARGESSEVFANPDGTLEAREYLRPVRARVDGEWRDIDTTLAVDEDGMVAPAVATVDLAFSGGGADDPLVRMTRAGRTLELSWPGTLPAPELDGSDAVYRDVLPDVDLRMGAGPDGFTQLLVVNSAEAAESAELDELTLGLDAAGMDVRVTDAGGVEAVDEGAGNAVFEAPAPLMWDSTTGAEAEPASVDTSEVGSDESARQGRVAVEVTDTSLALTPDPDILRGEETRYPVFIDPQWHTPGASAWTMVSRYWNDSPQWKFNGENNAGLGYCGWEYCAPEDLKRLFYRLPVSRFGGTKILEAQFRVPNVYSASCTDREVQVWRTKGIDSGTTWDSQNNDAFWIDRLDTQSFAYGYDGCAARDAEFNVLPAVQQAADADWSTLTLGMQATNESDRLGWKRFSDDAYLRVKYNRPPPQIKTSQLLMEYGGQCAPANDPTLVRSVGEIYATNVTDPDGDKVRVEFRALWDNGDGQGNVVRWESGLSTLKNSGSTFNVTLPDRLPDNGRVQWEARSHDGERASPWSASGSPSRCTFHLDTNVPRAPTVTSPEYPAADPADPQDGWHDGLGRYGDFTFDSPASDANRYRYGLNSDPRAANEVATTNGAARTVRLAPPKVGVNWVTVAAYDEAGNRSEPRTYLFVVRAGSPERTVWDLDEEAGAPSASGEGEPWEAALAGDAVTGAAGVSGGALQLGGESGYAATETSVVDTSKSFAVSLWARLPEGGVSATGTAVSQAGKNTYGFQISVDPGTGGWSFAVPAADSTSASVTRARQGEAATVGEWTHVVAVSDRPLNQLRLYVDGQLAATTAFTSPWEARGVVALGAALSGQTAGQFFAGEVDEIRFYDRWLSESQVEELHAQQSLTDGGRPAVAVWPLDEAAEATSVTGASQPLAADVHGNVTFGGEGVSGTSASFDGDTTTGSYLATEQPVLDTFQSFAVSAWVRLPEDKANQNMVVAAQTADTNWGFALVHAPDGRGWTFRRWTADDAEGSLVQASEWPCTSGDPDCANARLGAWTHVVGVHDLDAQELRLYVNGELVATEDFTGHWTATGRMTIGAADHRDGTPSGEFAGQIDDVRLFDRMTTAGEVEQLFQQNPQLAGRWQFEESDAGTTPDSSAAGTALNLSGGPVIGPGNVDDGALLLDGVDDHAATSAGTVPVDTSASFTVTAWAQAAALPDTGATVLSAAGAERSAFAVRFEPESADGRGTWQIVLPDEDDPGATVVSVDNARFLDARDWNHLALVYDGFRRQAQLYVNGMLAEVACAGGMDDACGSVSWAENVLTFPANHSLQVGRARTDTGGWGEYWPGAIDDVWAFQGALSSAQVAWLSMAFADTPTEVPPSS